MHIVKNSNKISTLINLQNNTDFTSTSRKCCDGNTYNLYPILWYVQVFIYRI